MGGRRGRRGSGESPVLPPIPVAVLDANVLYPAFLRDVLLRLAAEALFLPRWTDQIHDEWMRNVASDYAGDPPDVAGIRAKMDSAFPDALVSGHEELEDHFPTVDPEDRHVAAAAMRARASLIVTRNTRHFPETDLLPRGITPLDPDTFLCGLLGQEPETVVRLLDAHRRKLTGRNAAGERVRGMEMTPGQYHEDLRRNRVPRFASRLQTEVYT